MRFVLHTNKNIKIKSDDLAAVIVVVQLDCSPFAITIVIARSRRLRPDVKRLSDDGRHTIFYSNNAFQ